jgi:hypothetical protein
VARAEGRTEANLCFILNLIVYADYYSLVEELKGGGDDDEEDRNDEG